MRLTKTLLFGCVFGSRDTVGSHRAELLLRELALYEQHYPSEMLFGRALRGRRLSPRGKHL